MMKLLIIPILWLWEFTTALPNFLHFLHLAWSNCQIPLLLSRSHPYVDTSWYAMINIYKLQYIYIYIILYYIILYYIILNFIILYYIYIMCALYIYIYIHICTTLTWAFQLGPSIKFPGPLLRSYSSSRLDAPDFYGEDQSLINSNYPLANKHSYWTQP